MEKSAAEKLRAWSVAAERPMAWAGEKVGVTPRTMQRIAAGQATPSLLVATRIMALTGGAIRPEEWIVESEAAA